MIMLDILANNDWERPIYFTGGSYDDSEYLWMKKYLQLEGLVYKLVPIETNLGKENPYIMGRIDSELMYEIVMKWNWGNSERTDIYHDPETRKNSISFRSNMARLSELLINEDKFEKAKTIMDLAIEKMPIDYFGYYSLLVPFVDGYYRIDNVNKAKDLSKKIAYKYSDRLNYFSSLNANEQYQLGEEILTEIERYRALIEADLKHNEKSDLYTSLNQFVAAITPFRYLYGDYEFYTSLIDVAEGYYLIGEVEIAQNLSKMIADQFSERMKLFAQFPSSNQTQIQDRIKKEWSAYNYFLQIINSFDESSFFNTLEDQYNSNINLFNSESAPQEKE